MDTLFLTLSLTITLLLGEIHVGTTHWKWIPHKVVRPTWLSPNRRVSVRESARKRVFKIIINWNNLNVTDILVRNKLIMI